MNFLRVRRLHFVGIGGIGMSGLAELLKSVGLEVTGSDLRPSETTARLEWIGIHVFTGPHAEGNVQGADVVVYSSAVDPQTNPEVVAARRAGTPAIRRATMLGEVLRFKRGIGIAGTHGKTTTTSMTGAILLEAGLDPTIVVGGRMRQSGLNARLGEGEFVVVEADEFDRTFLELHPVLGVVTNVEAEHLDCYAGIGEIEDAFTRFLESVPFFGAAIVGIDDPGVSRIRARLTRRVVTYGVDPAAHVRAEEVSAGRNGTSFVVVADGTPLGRVAVPLAGLHNVKNALGALAVSRELEIPFETAARALERFSGVVRRFETKGERGGVLVVDDYAHHPTEVAATLQAARQAHPDRRLVVLFQPHLFTRTRDFAAGFGAAFLAADVLYVLDVYASREAPIPGVTGQLVADAARAQGHHEAHFVPGRSTVLPRLLSDLKPGDLLVTMGAGDVGLLGEELLASAPKAEGQERPS